jgi:PEP-CTERM/exosortase A-associated glycosyltransferase
MRILHVLDHSLPLHSGYAFRTVAILREQRARGWETLALTSPKQGPTAVDEEVCDGFTFHRTQVAESVHRARSAGALLRQMQATSARITGLIKSHAPDVVHAHSPLLNAFPALWSARRAGLPLVYEVRALWEDAAVDHGTTAESSARYRLSRGLESLAVRAADHVTTICEGLRTDILARGVPAERITVIPNAVDIEKFRVDGVPDPALRRKLGLDGRVVLGFAGSFYGYEGLDLLLEAMSRLARETGAGAIPVSLLLLGGGPQEARLREQAQKLGIADRVVFVGRVPHADVAGYYNLIDVLVYPRHSMRLTELVTPLKPLEAMAQGRVFIASDVGGHRELVADGQTGFLFRAGDVDALAAMIRKVLASREDWPRVRGNARRFVESERNWRNSVARYEPVYRAVLARSGRTRQLGAKGV